MNKRGDQQLHYDQTSENNYQNESGRNVISNRDNIASLNQSELAEIDLQLFNRLLKTSVIKTSPNLKTVYDRKVIVLDQPNTQKYLNGSIFANYLSVLKDVMIKKNQQFYIDDNLYSQIKDQNTPQAKLFNWNYLCNELDKIGISIDNDTKSLYVAGDSYEIGLLFNRIEQYVVQISNDASILDFQDYRKDDRKLNKSNNNQNQQNEIYMNQRRGLQQDLKKQIKDGVDIMQMDIRKEPSETESTLEFILNTLCRALSMKPKQSAALLTNNNQFLTHCVVKGVKGNYEPMINWYQEIYQYSRHLSDMLEIEVQNSIQSNDQKQIKAAQQNFEKVMQTIACGCYSQNLEVVQLCFKSLICIAQDFIGNNEAIKLSQKWFESKDSGLYNINYAFKRHPEIAEDFVNCIGNFTTDQQQLTYVYLQTIQEYYPEIVDYLNCISNLFPYLQIKYANQLVESKFITQLLERCMRYTDSSMQNTPQLRISAISLITEIWNSYSKYIDSQGQLTQMIQSIYQKNSRDKSRAIRLVTVSSIFKLIDKFSQEKNQSAPVLYKQLIFSLVENPSDQTSRELYLTNFQYLFNKNPQIPIGLLLEPFVKINQVRDVFAFVTFDYDFFSNIAQHQKLNIQNAIQMLDMFARQYLNDMCYSSAVSVPFIMICSRFIYDVQCQEFIIKFITISLNQLLQIDNNNDTHSPPQKGKILALPPSGSALLNKNVGRSSQVRSSNQQLNKDFRISSQTKSNRKDQLQQPTKQVSQEEEINNRLKKSYIIQILLKIQNLKQDDVNNAMRDMLLGAQKQYKDQNQGYLSNGIMAVLKYWGDPDQIFNFYLKNQEKIDTEERKALDKIQKQDQVERKMLGYESDDRRGDGSYGSNTLNVKKPKPPGRNSMALMPIVENQQNLRALQELEIIKKYKKEKEQEEQRKFELDIKKKTQKQSRLKEELMRRRVEIGVPQREAGGIKIELNALILKNEEGSALQKLSRANKQQIKLVDLDEEEDRDNQILIQYMKKYSKIWKYLFSRYCNQMYSHKGKKDFDDMNNKLLQISLPEIIKMLKDHDTYPQLIEKDETAQIIRLINIKSNQENSRDLTMLDFSQFLQFVPQLAFVCCSRPPLDMRSLPLIGSLQALLNQFEKATRDRGKSTAIFDDPDTSNFADKQLLAALEKNCAQNPNYVVPQGFKKQIEMIPIFKFELPQCAKKIMKTSQVVVTELLDQILFNALDIHILEPIVTFEQKIKVKQQVTKLVKPPVDSNYMRQVDKKVDEQKQKGTAYVQMSAAEKRREAMEIKPKINLALKLQVTKQDLRDRPLYQEVAEVFEEMLQAVEKGQMHLPQRQNRAPGQIINPAKIQNEQREKDERDRMGEKEKQRQDRNKEVKKLLEETKFGGREMPIADFHKLQLKIQARDKLKQDLNERKNFQILSQKAKQDVDDLKTKQLEEIKKQRDQEQKGIELEKQKAEMARKQFLSLQKQKHINNFQETTVKRDTIIMKKEDMNKEKHEIKQQLANQVTKQIEGSIQNREIEKQERTEIERFINKQDVENVFQQYQKPLYELFSFYANLDNKKNQLAFEDEWQKNAISLKELVQFGKQQNITPEFITTNDMLFIFKRLVREQEDNFKDEIKIRAGMLDFVAFKKAIVRISIIAQEKLGVGNQDQLRKKLIEDQNKSQIEKQLKEMKLKANQRKVEEKSQQLKKLKEQFLQEQQYKQQVLSKAPKDKRQQQDQLEDKNMNPQQYAAKQEQDFQKWMKQRENLGISLDQVKPSDSIDTPQRASIKKKDKLSKELDDLQKQQEEAQKIKLLKVEDKEVRTKMDVGIINALTIEAFIKYIELDQNHQTGQVARRLTETLNQRATLVGRKNQDGAPIPGFEYKDFERE